MILAARAVVICCCFAPVLAWTVSGSAPAAWICGAAGGAGAAGTRALIGTMAGREKGSDGRP